MTTSESESTRTASAVAASPQLPPSAPAHSQADQESQTSMQSHKQPTIVAAAHFAAQPRRVTLMNDGAKPTNIRLDQSGASNQSLKRNSCSRSAATTHCPVNPLQDCTNTTNQCNNNSANKRQRIDSIPTRVSVDTSQSNSASHSNATPATSESRAPVSHNSSDWGNCESQSLLQGQQECILATVFSMLSDPVSLCRAFRVCKHWSTFRADPRCFQLGLWCDLMRPEWSKRSQLCGMIRFVQRTRHNYTLCSVFDSNPQFEPLSRMGLETKSLTSSGTRHKRSSWSASKQMDKSGAISGRESTRNRYSVCVAFRARIVIILDSNDTYTSQHALHSMTHQEAALRQGLTRLPAFMPRLREPDELVSVSLLPLTESCWICDYWQQGVAAQEIDPIDMQCSCQHSTQHVVDSHTVATCGMHAHTRFEYAYALFALRHRRKQNIQVVWRDCTITPKREQELNQQENAQVMARVEDQVKKAKDAKRRRDELRATSAAAAAAQPVDQRTAHSTQT